MIKHKQGDSREDGFVFWQYRPTSKNKEYWITKDKYNCFIETRQKYRKNNKDKINAGIYLWKKRNPEKAKAIKRRYQKNKRASDPLFCLIQRCRERTTKIFYRNGYSKTSRTHELLGCDWEFLKTHIEKQFRDGMSWENRDKWHIDHIMPLATSKSKKELEKLCHWTNLQPLWAIDNLKKKKKIPTY
jgi:hypothetical protein